MTSEVLLMGTSARVFTTSFLHELAAIESEQDKHARLTGDHQLDRSRTCGGAISNSRREERNFAWIVQSSMGSGLLSRNPVRSAPAGSATIQVAAIFELIVGGGERCDAVWL